MGKVVNFNHEDKLHHNGNGGLAAVHDLKISAPVAEGTGTGSSSDYIPTELRPDRVSDLDVTPVMIICTIWASHFAHTTTFPHEVCTVTTQITSSERLRSDLVLPGRYLQHTQVCLISPDVLVGTLTSLLFQVPEWNKAYMYEISLLGPLEVSAK
jgi:hypothetical protein